MDILSNSRQKSTDSVEEATAQESIDPVEGAASIDSVKGATAQESTNSEQPTQCLRQADVQVLLPPNPLLVCTPTGSICICWKGLGICFSRSKSSTITMTDHNSSRDLDIVCKWNTSSILCTVHYLNSAWFESCFSCTCLSPLLHVVKLVWKILS